MSKLEVYSSVREQEEYFNVEIINDIGSLKEYIGKEKSQKDVVLYRGVNDGSYKMYSSLQRLWVGCDEKNESLGYEDFLNLIWEKSEYLKGGFFKQHYNDSHSTVTYNGEKASIPYNILWLFFTLQHYSECSPLIDFTNVFNNALFFAAYDAKCYDDTLCASGQEYLPNYIQIISIDNENVLENHVIRVCEQPYSSFIHNIMQKIEDGNPKDVDEVVKRYCEMAKPISDSIQYVCYESEESYLAGNLPPIQWNIQWENENVRKQLGRLYLTSSEMKPLEEQWKEKLGKKDNYVNNLRMNKVLIKKSLLPCIERYLCCEFAEDGLEAIYKKLVPVRINCKDYITELLTGEIG